MAVLPLPAFRLFVIVPFKCITCLCLSQARFFIYRMCSLWIPRPWTGRLVHASSPHGIGFPVFLSLFASQCHSCMTMSIVFVSFSLALLWRSMWFLFSSVIPVIAFSLHLDTVSQSPCCQSTIYLSCGVLLCFGIFCFELCSFVHGPATTVQKAYLNIELWVFYLISTFHFQVDSELVLIF